MYRVSKQGAASRFNTTKIRTNELKALKEQLLLVLSTFLASQKTDSDKTLALNKLAQIETAIGGIGIQLVTS
jgi:hypothetical protein